MCEMARVGLSQLWQIGVPVSMHQVSCLHAQVSRPRNQGMNCPHNACGVSCRLLPEQDMDACWHLCVVETVLLPSHAAQPVTCLHVS